MRLKEMFREIPKIFLAFLMVTVILRGLGFSLESEAISTFIIILNTTLSFLAVISYYLSPSLTQHFSFYPSQPIDSPGIIADFKSVSNSEFFQAFTGPHLLLKSEGKRGRNEKKLLWKIDKIYEGCLPY